MRPKKKGRDLPACMYEKHGAYYYVKRNVWTRLSDNRQDAFKKYAELTQRAARGGSMAELIDRVIEHHAQFISSNTLTQYNQAAERLKIIFAEFEPHQVMQKHVAAVKVSMSDTPNMGNRVLSFLKLVFQYALEWGISGVDSNPCIGIRRHKEGKRDRYITHAELEALLAHCSDYMSCIFEMAYLTGQRISDVLAIKLSDITTEGIEFKAQKTGKKMLVEMTPDIQEVIERAKALPRKVRGMTLFCARSGRPVTYETVKEAFAKARTAAGIEDVKIHDLRAKALTDAQDEGKDPQKLGNHATMQVTKRYLRGRKPTHASGPTMPRKNE